MIMISIVGAGDLS